MTTRAAVTGAKRVVVKVGSSSLTTAAGGIDPERVRALVDTLQPIEWTDADEHAAEPPVHPPVGESGAAVRH